MMGTKTRHALLSAVILLVSGGSFFVDSAFAQSGYPYSQVPFTSVKITPNSFWGDRIKAARDVTIPLAFSKCESEHRYKNFKMAAYTLQHPGHAGLSTSEWDVAKIMGFPFDDTDVYKTIEGASYILQTYTDQEMMEYIDSVLNIVAAAQEPDGYLYTARTINPAHPHEWSCDHRWDCEEYSGHELYNLGHMVDAACAHYQATGSSKFLDIARRFADCVIREVGPHEGQVHKVSGHEIAEMALARLFVLTGEKKYLDEARYLIDYRGKTDRRDRYSQSDKPVIEQREAWGHAVRAGYLYAGIADVAALTGGDYVEAIDAICENIISKKYYITGGVGARHDGESFGADYELPNLTAYNETCAAIAMVYLFERMFLLHGDAKYIDCLERTLYNGVISGMSVDGGRFFYPNPLSSDGTYCFNSDNTKTRQIWFGCSCCPSNLCRFIPSMPGYVYGVRGDSLYVNLFTANTATIKIGGSEVTLEEITGYPWEGDITIRINRISGQKSSNHPFTMMVRVPGWVQNKPVPSNLYSYSDDVHISYEMSVNGERIEGGLENGYLPICCKWKEGDVVHIHFDMPVRTVAAHPCVTDDYGRVAIERGPLVYCIEWADQSDTINLNHLQLVHQPHFVLQPSYSITNTEGDGQTFSVTAISALAQEVNINNEGHLSAKDVKVTLIPYYAWCHRGAGRMEVWMGSNQNVQEE